MESGRDKSLNKVQSVIDKFELYAEIPNDVEAADAVLLIRTENEDEEVGLIIGIKQGATLYDINGLINFAQKFVDIGFLTGEN